LLLALVLLISLGLAACSTQVTTNTTTTTTATTENQDYFTIAVLPDTQYYSESNPGMFKQQTQWIADHVQSQHIDFVIQVGDLVQDYSVDKEWINAQKAMNVIRNAGIPYSVVPGNHDVNFAAGNPTYYDKYFPYTDFTGYPWYGSGQYPPGKGAPAPNYPANSNTSNYETFSAMGQNLLILNLACTPKVLVNKGLYDWANNVLSYYRKYRAIVVTHGYIDTTGNFTDESDVSGIEIWNNVVKQNSNIAAVICGHITGKTISQSTGTNGNIIENLLFDTQEETHGGTGWLRLYKFYPKLNQVSAITYSPYLAQYDDSPQGTFSFNMKMTP
jgi:3',5'-cyclic AMP phosphodiesterase CpdA